MEHKPRPGHTACCALHSEDKSRDPEARLADLNSLLNDNVDLTVIAMFLGDWIQADHTAWDHLEAAGYANGYCDGRKFVVIDGLKLYPAI